MLRSKTGFSWDTVWERSDHMYSCPLYVVPLDLRQWSKSEGIQCMPNSKKENTWKGNTRKGRKSGTTNGLKRTPKSSMWHQNGVPRRPGPHSHTDHCNQSVTATTSTTTAKAVLKVIYEICTTTLMSLHLWPIFLKLCSYCQRGNAHNKNKPALRQTKLPSGNTFF